MLEFAVGERENEKVNGQRARARGRACMHMHVECVWRGSGAQLSAGSERVLSKGAAQRQKLQVKQTFSRDIMHWLG